MKPESPSTGSPAPTQSVAIPGVLIDFLQRATVGMAGTRDAAGVPRLHRIVGWKVGSDGRTLTIHVPRLFLGNMEQSLADNGRLAVTIEEIGPHETYQFKGRHLRSRPCDEADRALCGVIRERFAEIVATRFGLSPQACLDFSPPPETAVELEVHEIFVQTPGPGAGQRLAPPEPR